MGKARNLTLNFDQGAPVDDIQYKVMVGEFLAGGGGVTTAIARIKSAYTRWILNHDPVAIRTNLFHHQEVKHYWADLYKQDEHEMENVDYAWASIDCKEHTPAKGSKIKKVQVYTLGWELIRYLKQLNPYVLGIENVPGFKRWAPLRVSEDPDNSTDFYTALSVDENGKYYFEPDITKKGESFEKWKQSIIDLGYDYHEKIINAADVGLPTRRTRFFCFFTKKDLEMTIRWPEITHHKTGEHGLLKWNSCRQYIDLKKEGNSIFGRKFNSDIRPHKRFPLSSNTLKRIVGGIKKFHPDLYFIMQYYGNGLNCQNLESPLNAVPARDCHALIKLEKLQFIQDYCRGDLYNDLNEPLGPQLTWQTKQAITVDFISDGTFSSEAKNFSLEEPLNALTGQQRHQLVNAGFISIQNNSNGNPASNNSSLDQPLWALTAKEKMQFISLFFNSNGKPGSQNQSLDSPHNAITSGTNKSALITAIQNGQIDFDVKMRFLEPEELACISTFPKGYFTHPDLDLSVKDATRLIGNAVPPDLAEKVNRPVIEDLNEILIKRRLQAA